MFFIGYRWCNQNCEYIREFSKKFETALIVYRYSGAWGKLIHKKNLNSNISWQCLFQLLITYPLCMLGSLIHETAMQRFHQLLQVHVILNTVFYYFGNLPKKGSDEESEPCCRQCCGSGSRIRSGSGIGLSGYQDLGSSTHILRAY